MTPRRVIVLAALAAAFAAPSATFAQQSGKVHRIGYLGAETAAASAKRVQALRAGFKDLGYIEGQTFALEFRWANGKYEKLPALAAEFAALKIDALVTDGDKAALGAKQGAGKLPIVMGSTTDPVGLHLVQSLARPGGNITGLATFGPQVMAKRLELLKELMPHTSRVGVLLNSENPASALILEAMNPTAKGLKIELQPIEVSTLKEIEAGFASLTKKRVDAIAVQNETLFIANARRVADLAMATKTPSIARVEFVDAGGLIGYGANNLELYRRAATFVDKILKGANPGDLPIEQAVTFDLAVNMKTAKALGVKIPSPILVQATKVIE